MNEIMIYQSGEHAIEVIVTIKDDTVWLNRQQLSELFNRDSKTIGKHITNVFKEEELVRTSTVAKFETVQKEGKRLVHREIEYYNLDVIISVGYRVKSDQGVKFRQWATARLKDFLVQGYLSDPPKIVPLINRDYSLTFGKKRYEKDTIFGDANSHDSTIA
jgi:hypothetical protein